MTDHKTSKKTKVIMVLLLIGFMFMEFPGVFFFKDMAEPRLFGFPFIYGYILICWAAMCVILFIAYRLNWGMPADKDDEPEELVEKTEGGSKS